MTGDFAAVVIFVFALVVAWLLIGHSGMWLDRAVARAGLRARRRPRKGPKPVANPWWIFFILAVPAGIGWAWFTNASELPARGWPAGLGIASAFIVLGVWMKRGRIP